MEHISLLSDKNPNIIKIKQELAQIRKLRQEDTSLMLTWTNKHGNIQWTGQTRTKHKDTAKTERESKTQGRHKKENNMRQAGNKQRHDWRNIRKGHDREETETRKHELEIQINSEV